MRVSTSSFTRGTLRNLRDLTERMVRAQAVAGDGRRLRAMSDDPVSGSLALRIESQVRDLEQCVRNGKSATLRLSAEDVALTAARDLLARARSVAMSVESTDPADPTRQAALAEIDALRAQLVGLANTRVGNESIFAGGRTSGPAFQANGTYLGDDKVRQAEIDAGVRVDVNHPGDAVFGAALDALSTLSGELAGGTPAGVQAALASLRTADDAMLVTQAEVGVRLDQVRQVGRALAVRTNDLLDRHGALVNVDPAQAIVEAQTAQLALERAYAATSRMISTSLLDYLR